MSPLAITRAACPVGAQLEEDAYAASHDGKHSYAERLYLAAAEEYRRATLLESAAFCEREAERERSWFKAR